MKDWEECEYVGDDEGSHWVMSSNFRLRLVPLVELVVCGCRGCCWVVLFSTISLY